MNSLADQYPKIAQEWYYEKNAPLTPGEVTPGSNKLLWWKCALGHSWQATVNNRTRKGSGCPYCSGREAISGENDLETLYPSVAEEWDYEKNAPLLPSQVLPGSQRIVAWICEKQHRWDAKIYDRAIRGDRCPFCSGHRTSAGVNDFASAYPDLCLDWDYDCIENPNPKTIRPMSDEKVQWKCHVCGYIWKEQVADRIKRKRPCAKCSGKILIIGINDLDSQFPKIAAEWNEHANGTSNPEQFRYNSSKRVSWKCEKGHVWECRICDRTRFLSNCPYCSGRYSVPGENDLQSRHPDIAAQWCFEKNGSLTPDKVSEKSNKKVWWKCEKCGQTWEASVNMRVTKQTDCPYCSGRYPIPGKTDFATLHPELLEEWDYESNTVKPDEITGSSSRKVNWCCKKGHKWEATVKSRVQMHSGCPYCSGRRPIVGETDLATLRPHLMVEWNYEKNELPPTGYTVHSGKTVWWKCTEGHEWKACIYQRAEGYKNCPKCRRKKKID